MIVLRTIRHLQARAVQKLFRSSSRDKEKLGNSHALPIVHSTQPAGAATCRKTAKGRRRHERGAAVAAPPAA